MRAPNWKHRTPRQQPATSETTIYVRRAVQGEMESVGWLVQRFQRFLVETARKKVGNRMGPCVDPEELVQRLWLVTIPRLGDLKPRDGRLTPVLMRFLSTVLLRDVASLGRRRRTRGVTHSLDEISDFASDECAEEPIDALVQRERHQVVWAVLRNLPEPSRRLIERRAIDGVSYAELAEEMGQSRSNLRVQYHRALVEFRRRLPMAMAMDEGAGLRKAV